MAIKTMQKKREGVGEKFGRKRGEGKQLCLAFSGRKRSREEVRFCWESFWKNKRRKEKETKGCFGFRGKLSAEDKKWEEGGE